MGTCARCGAVQGHEIGQCSVFHDDWFPRVIACRDRELANLRSLLRSVTGKLEKAAEYVATAESCDGSAHIAMALIDQVLEALS